MRFPRRFQRHIRQDIAVIHKEWSVLQQIGHIGEGRTVGYAAHGAAGTKTTTCVANDALRINGSEIRAKVTPWTAMLSRL